MAVRRANLPDRVFGTTLSALGAGVFLVAGVILLELSKVSGSSVAKMGLWHFVTGREWDPVHDLYGALPFIYGTLVTSGLAILLAVPASLGLALFVTQMAPARLRSLISFPVALLAGIPSVVFGLWAIFVLVPYLKHSYLAGGVILAIMILPTISSISIEVLQTVPGVLREAALALGATRWETIRLSVLPHARAGILGAVILGLGRALGETMAVTMVIGNSPTISASLFAPGYSLPAVIANEFAEAGGMQTSALAALGLILFGVTLLLNIVARLLVRMSRKGPRA